MALQVLLEMGSFDDELAKSNAITMVALVTISIGYEASNVPAGDPLDVFWLVALGGATAVFAALYAHEDD